MTKFLPAPNPISEAICDDSCVFYDKVKEDFTIIGGKACNAYCLLLNRFMEQVDTNTSVSARSCYKLTSKIPNQAAPVITEEVVGEGFQMKVLFRKEYAPLIVSYCEVIDRMFQENEDHNELWFERFFGDLAIELPIDPIGLYVLTGRILFDEYHVAQVLDISWGKTHIDRLLDE
jgi:hypothetical protein